MPCICAHFPQDKAKVKIRKLNDPPKADAVRDMVRYARNVIEEFRRAKHYKYILCRWRDVSPKRCWRVGQRERKGGFQLLDVEGRRSPGKWGKTF